MPKIAITTYLKLPAFLMVLCVAGASLGHSSPTSAFYSDTEASKENIFTAGILDLVLSSASFEGVITNDPGDEVQFAINAALLEDSLEAQHKLTYEFTGGSSSMCDALHAAVDHSDTGYDGALALLHTDASGDEGLWEFFITASGPVAAGETCAFDLVFTAWIDSATTVEESGYADEERVHVVITAEAAGSPVVINEFLPAPDGILCNDGGDDCAVEDPDFIFDFGDDSADMPKGEWVELYNVTANPVDLAGWYTGDASGGGGNTIYIASDNTFPATTIIPANGYLVVYMNKAVWNNTGDTVKLYNSSGILMDSYAYTSDYDYCYLTPTQGGVNDEIPAGADVDCTPGATIPSNKSYARIPDGVGSFVDPIPTPGISNLSEGEELRFEMDEVPAVQQAAVVVVTQPEETASSTATTTPEEAPAPLPVETDEPIVENPSAETPPITDSLPGTQNEIPQDHDDADEEDVPVLIPNSPLVQDDTVTEAGEKKEEIPPAREEDVSGESGGTSAPESSAESGSAAPVE